MFFRRFCVKNDIVMIGFSPFGSPDLPWGQKLPPILEEDTIKSIAESKGRTPALVALRWLLQRGLATTPKVEIIPLDGASRFKMIVPLVRQHSFLHLREMRVSKN